jgi:hypothetical protein
MMKMIAGLAILIALSAINCSYYLPYYDYFVADPQKYPSALHVMAIAPSNLIEEAPEIIMKKAMTIDTMINDYVQEKGIEIINQETTKAKWNKAKAENGGYYNPENGKIDSVRFMKCLSAFSFLLSKEYKVDVIVFPSVERRSGACTAQSVLWDGACRDVKAIQKYSDISRQSFSGTLATLSMKLFIVNMYGETLFLNYGGIEPAVQINFTNNSSGELEPREDLLRDKAAILKAIKIAFHPVIVSKGIPVKTGSVSYKLKGL